MYTLVRRQLLQGLGAIAGTAALPNLSLADGSRAITVAVNKLPENISPGRDTSDIAVPISYNIFDKLIEPDFHNQMALGPGLATSWTMSEHREVVFKLREGVKFHNGDTMTAEDVAFTFSNERREAEGPRRLAQFFSNIAETHAEDETTARIVMKDVDPLIEQRFSMWSGEVVSKRAYQDADDYAAWGLAPVGTGPFRVEKIGTESIELVAFEDHFRGSPNVASVRFIEVPEVAARVAGLASGDFDVVTVVPPDQISTIDRFDDVEVVGGPGAKIRIIIFNQGDSAVPIMKDVHFRRALSLAIDREAIVQSLYGGLASVPNGLQAPTFGEIYAPDYPKPVYDLDRAREELKLSGYGGETVDYPLLSNVLENEIAIAEVLTAMWQSIGINVELNIRENWSQITKAHHSIRNMSATMLWQDPATIIWRIFKPSVIDGRGWKWHNDTFAQAGLVLEHEPDKAKRREAFETMQRIWEFDDPIGAILFQELWLYGKRKDLDWTPYSLPYMDFGPTNV